MVDAAKEKTVAEDLACFLRTNGHTIRSVELAAFYNSNPGSNFTPWKYGVCFNSAHFFVSQSTVSLSLAINESNPKLFGLESCFASGARLIDGGL